MRTTARRGAPGTRRAAGVRRVRTAAVALALLGAFPALSGCGIRGTAVPVDAGGAPSRASCVAQPDRSLPAGLATVTVQLVCSSQLVPVTRQVSLPDKPGDTVVVARALLDELRRAPSAREAEAGLTTAVPQRLTVGGPRSGDPAGTLRLGREPDELPQVALAQLVCTYASTAAADGRGTVILGGPAEERPKGYACTESMRTHPDTAEIPGGPVT
ncbi:hypothetical protein [Streptomyces eurocidicus]|uniref:Uncharacterized protein n=1 Tax=Streptomyces eurocidicus TaxID=66423 RepID=A0A7W8BBA8_STREU|nr:hypothetical protein [Streptomyces eurocidicus]MBB5119682.1 hypothetical protein [Streptomyces eurocidicus]MBF6050708.1 hypothetical protein [Streptomyces eurocidicus]